MMRLSIVIISAASFMLWYQQFRTWAFALSLAIWHIIIQGCRYFFHASKPAAEELPIAISGSTFTPTHESIAMDPDILLACRLYLAARASRMAKFSTSQPSSPSPNVSEQNDVSNDPFCPLVNDSFCILQPQDPSPISHVGFTSSPSYDSPSEYGTTPPSSPNLDPPILVVSAPTEEDFKLDRFQDEQESNLDSSCLGMDSEIEVQELASLALSSPEDEDVVVPDAEPLALVAYKSKTKCNGSLRLIAPVSVPLKRVGPEFHDPPTYTRALRDSLLLSPPPFSSRRRPATGDLARCRGFKGSSINTTSVKTPLIFQPSVTTPTQSAALQQTTTLLPSQESAKSTFSAVVDRVRASTNSRSVRCSSARHEAKRVPPSVQETYDEADPFSTNSDSFYAPSFVHSDINNIGPYMTPESSKSRKVTEPRLRRKNSRHDLRTEEVKTYKMKTTLYDMSIYGVPSQDNSKLRTRGNPSSKSSTYTELSPSLEIFPFPTSTVGCTSRPESELPPLPSSSVNEKALPESTFLVADDPFTKDMCISLPVGVPPGDLYNFDVYAPSKSYRSKTNLRPVSLSKDQESETEELRRLSANVSAYAAEVFPFSLNANPLSPSLEDDFSSTEDVPHLRAILDGMDFSPLLLPCFMPISTAVPISSLDLDSRPEPLSSISVQDHEPVPVPQSTAPPGVIIKSHSEVLSLTDVDGYSISMGFDPVSFPYGISFGNDAVCDFNVNMVPGATPYGRANYSLPVIQPGADPSVATATLVLPLPTSSSPPRTIQCEPLQTCPNLEPSSVVAVSGGLGPIEVPHTSWTNLASVVDTYSQNLGVEYLNETTVEGNLPITGFLQAGSHSSRSRNPKDENIEPSSRRVGIHGSLPRQRNSTSGRRSSNLSAQPSEHTSNQTRAIVLERHRASVLCSASHRTSGLRDLRLPQRVALRERNTEVGASTLSTDSTTLVSTSLDDAKEPALSEAGRNRNSLDALIALIESDMKASSDLSNLSAPSFQKSSSSQYSIQWGVAF